jgi:hypothetical protein
LAEGRPRPLAWKCTSDKGRTGTCTISSTHISIMRGSSSFPLLVNDANREDEFYRANRAFFGFHSSYYKYFNATSGRPRSPPGSVAAARGPGKGEASRGRGSLKDVEEEAETTGVERRAGPWPWKDVGETCKGGRAAGANRATRSSGSHAYACMRRPFVKFESLSVLSLRSLSAAACFGTAS